MLFGAFFSDLDPLLLAVCDDDLCVLLCVDVCVTDSSVCDSSLCGCFRGLSLFGFFLLLGRIFFFFFFEVGCREEVGGGTRRYTDTARAREREGAGGEKEIIGREMDPLEIMGIHDVERYELVKDIGSGNFGVARLMRDKKTRELVAVKYIERGEKVNI